MTALAIIVTDAARADAALRVAAAAAALGRDVTMLFDGASVTALAATAPHALVGDALELGVRISACQSGLALARLPADALVARVEAGGMVGFLAENAEAQLVLA